MQIIPTNGHTEAQSPQVLPFTLKPRVLVSRGVKPSDPTTFHLEEVRDYLAKLEKLQDPVDHDRSLDQLHVAFSGKHMTGRFLRHDGISDEVLLVTDTGASQLSRDVLPSRFFSGLKTLAQMDESGEKLATLVWAKFSGKKETVRMVRTIRMKVSGQVYRAIRSCHSQGYAPYSNLQFVQDLLDHAGHFAELPVLDWRVADNGLRLRFAGIDKELSVLRHWDGGDSGDGVIPLNEPIPMIECWNSETGQRRVGLRGGMFKLVCTNGMGHWDDKREWNWIHRGSASRIQDGVRSAFEDILTSANGVVEAYQQALNVSIDDTFAWMEAELHHQKVPERVITAAQTALTDPTTTEGGSLASVVDALTLIAQQEDMFQQYELERSASRILRRGLSQSLKTGGSLLAQLGM
jgi:hypothetical protein